MLATTLLGETIKPYHILGFALILGGVTLAARSVQGGGVPGQASGREPRASLAPDR